MDSSRKIIDDIISISQRLINGLVAVRPNREVGETRETSARIQLAGDLHKIIATSMAIMETLTESLGYGHDTLDERLTDWLTGREPAVCRHVLDIMAKLLRVDDDRNVSKWFPMLPKVTPSRDNTKEAIILFAEHKAHFYLLLTTDVWDRESRPGPSGLDKIYVDPSEATTLNLNTPELKDEPMTIDTVTHGAAETISEKNREVDWKQLEDILQWLDGLNCAEKHENTLELHQSGTCTWLFGTQAFKGWRHGEDSFLWLHGKPGAGKSVLAAFVIDSLENSLADDEVLAYFYCDFRTERSTVAAEVMRSILSQLLDKLCHGSVDTGDILRDLAREKKRGGSILKNAKRLASLVFTVVKRFARRPLIVIDALDECSDKEVLADALASLHQARLRLFTTSRSLQVIKEKFADAPCIPLEKMSDALSADIRLHVTRELDRDRRLRIAPANLKEEIRTTLCENADGMFRWIQCQLETLRRCMTPMDIRRALDNLPKGLEETYRQILLAIDKEEREAKVARRALMWLVAAFSSLRLSQIVEALSIDLNKRTLNPDLAPLHGSALLDALSSLVTYDEDTDIVILSHFSVQEYLTGEHSRSHFAAYHVDPQFAEEQLAQYCMCYLAVCLNQPETASDHEGWTDSGILESSMEHDAVDNPSPESKPLFGYVLSHTFQHFGLVDWNHKSLLVALGFLEVDVRRNPLGWDRMRPKGNSVPWPSSRDDFTLYVLVAFAPEPLLRLFLGRDPVRPKAGTNPLVYAAHLDKVAHAKTLLSRGAPVNGIGLLVTSPRPLLLTPLEAAVRRGSRNVIDLLLTREIPIQRRMLEHVFRPSYFQIGAGARIAARLLQTDEFAEWAVEDMNNPPFLDFLDNLDYTHIRVVVDPREWPNDEDVVTVLRRLVQVGCDPNKHRSSLHSIFHQAVAAGHIGAVKYMLSLGVPLPPDILLCVPCTVGRPFLRNSPMIPLLLANGVDLRAVTDEGRNALHVTADSKSMDFVVSEDDCLERVTLLIDAGCDPSAHDLSDRTPLWFAARRGFKSVVQYMLSRGAVRPRNLLFSIARTPSKKASMLRFLICTGDNSDVLVTADNGDTMLHVVLECSESSEGHQGSEEDCLESTKLFVNAGCNTNTTNALGDTPMDIALRTGHAAVVEYFLSMGVPLPPDALMRALSLGGLKHPQNTLQMIRLLVRKGVGGGFTSADGSNALHSAIAYYRDSDLREIVELLVEAGCNLTARNATGDTPIHLATRYMHRAIVTYFLSSGMPIPHDIMLVVTSVDLFNHLSERGANLHAVAENGDTVLHVVINKTDVEQGALKLTKALIHAGCSPHTPNAKGETPLQVAVRRGRVSIVEYILSLDPSLVLPSNLLLTASCPRLPGHYNSGVRMIRFLVEKLGLSVNVITDDGDSVLHLALSSLYIKEDHALEVAKVLVHAGCEPLAQNFAGEMALHAAAKTGSLTVIEYFLSQGVPLPSDILLASGATDLPNHKPRTIRFLIDKGADIHAVTTNGDTPLHLTLASGLLNIRLRAARILVEANCDPSRPNLAGRMPVHVAASSGYPGLVKYLRSKNVPLPSDILLSAADALPITPNRLRHPTRVPEMFNLLIREGADVHTVASNGDGLLHIAFRKARAHRCATPWKLIGVLLRAGCDPWARDAEGKTSFDVAEEQGDINNYRRLVRTYCDPDQRQVEPECEPSGSKRRATDEVGREVQASGQWTKRGRFDDMQDEAEMAEVDEGLMV